MADAAPVMIWASGADKLCTFFNRIWLEFTGRRVEEELGNGWADGVHPDDLERCYAPYCSAFDERRSFEMEYRLRRADGEYRWLLDRGVPRSSGGVFAGYIGSCIDITDLKQSHDRMLAAQKLESLAVMAAVSGSRQFMGLFARMEGRLTWQASRAPGPRSRFCSLACLLVRRTSLFLSRLRLRPHWHSSLARFIHEYAAPGLLCSEAVDSRAKRQNR
jgi:PAS domain S-box-containing protein